MVLQVRELGPELLADARSRLLTGLKRYFHSKRLEGLLSAQARPFDIVHVHTYSMLVRVSGRAAHLGSQLVSLCNRHQGAALRL